MKKTYIKPELFVEECIVEKIISTSGGDIGGTGSGGVSTLSLRNLPPTSIVVYGTMSGATNNPNGH